MIPLPVPAWDLNCDLGEGEAPAHTAALMGLIDSANIACGGHAGDEATIHRCLELATVHHVRTGAHPGLPDRAHFGRASGALESLTPDRLTALLIDQVGTLFRIATGHGLPLHHVKLHGALYHAVETRPDLAAAYRRTVATHWPGTVIYARAGGRLVGEEPGPGLEIWPEGYLDRGYADDGTLVPRDQAGALLHSIDDVLDRVRDLRSAGRCRSIHGNWIPLAARTWCMHGDSPGAIDLLRAVRQLVHPGVVGSK